MLQARHLIAGLFALSAGIACAGPITPTFTSFGTLAGATFGGQGIPNTAVAIFESQGDLTMGLTATGRYTPPGLLANDGAGTFTAVRGISPFAPSPADPYATWNFDFYVGGGDVSDLSFRLFYDFDPAAGNDESTHGVIGFAGIGLQNSWNLGMNFLAALLPSGSFDPNATGEYTFALAAYMGGDEIGRTAIQVNVVDPAAIPEPGSLALAGLALLAVQAARRRRG